MQSLDDLDLEHETGGIDEESYTELHDDYTARAAAVIRTLRDGVDVTPAPAPRSPNRTRRRVVLVSVVLVFAIAAGTSLAYAFGARLPGQTASGNSRPRPRPRTQPVARWRRRSRSCEKQGQRQPDDYDLRLELARAYEENGDLQNALKQSDAAITIDAQPTRGERQRGAAALPRVGGRARAPRRSATRGAGTGRVHQAIDGGSRLPRQLLLPRRAVLGVVA